MTSSFHSNLLPRADGPGEFSISKEKQMIQERLRELAVKESKPFCYACYTYGVKTETEVRCPRCFSDDLMRITADDGPEYGFDWIIEDLVRKNCEALSDEDMEERFMGLISEIYGNVSICGYNWDAAEALKRLDPVAFDQELSAFIDNEHNETLMTFDHGSTYYDLSEIERLLDQKETTQAPG